MANVLITGYCNRHCPYCFARGAFVLPFNNGEYQESELYMSLDNLGKVIEFFQESGQNTMRVMGGEPTLHPEFPLVIETILGAGIKVELFTGGIIPDGAMEYLQTLESGQVQIVINIPESDDGIRRSEFPGIEDSLKTLGKLSILGFTIYKPEFDYRFLIDLVELYQCNRVIRLGIALPRLDVKKPVLEPGDYRMVAQQILRFAEACDRNDISLSFDCGFVFCMFTYRELGRLKAYNTRARFVCSPIGDIGPDLSVWSCFPLLPLERVRLENFRTFGEVREYFTSKQKAYRTFGVYNYCHSCKYKKRGQCSGGCLAHVIRKFS